MAGVLPEKWHIYSPLWAQVRLEGSCLTLRDSEPWDYAKAMRVFPESRRAEARIRLTVRGGRNGMLHLELSDAKGMNAGRLVLAEDGRILLRGGDGDWPVGAWQEGETLELALLADCGKQQLQAEVNGQPSRVWPMMCPVLSLERLTLRTGPVRTWPTPEDNLKNVCTPDYPHPGDRLPEAVYSIASVEIR